MDTEILEDFIFFTLSTIFLSASVQHYLKIQGMQGVSIALTVEKNTQFRLLRSQCTF